MVPRCEKLQMANFGSNSEGLILEGACNANCNCTTKSFTPVCGSDMNTLYFSPCYAGCQQSSNQTYSQCSCISTLPGEQKDFVTEGFCMADDCWLQAIQYIIAWPILEFFVSLLRVMHTIMILRSIEPQDKSFALGAFEALTCILGWVPYLLVFGAMVDTACLVWEKSCGETGNCWFYDIDKFSNILHGMSAGFSIVQIFTMSLIFYLRARFYDMYEEDEDIDTDGKNNRIALTGQGTTTASHR